jgi:HK97 family phage major capsid protein
MSAVVEAKSAMRRLGAKAQDVVNDDTLTMAEKKSALEALSADLKSHEETISLHEKAARLMEGGEAVDAETAHETRVKSVGQAIIESAAFKSAAGSRGSRFSASAEIKTANPVNEGTTISSGQLNGQGGVLALPDYLPGIVDIRYAPLGVGDLFAQGATTSPLVSYVKQSAQTLGGAATSEKGLKGQSDATFARVNEQVGKIAAFFKITDEMLQDVAQAESFLTNMLVKELAREEENEILNGTGYPAINGILNRSGLATAVSAGTTGTIAAPSKLIEAIFKQITAIRTTAFVEPDAIVINPTDWQYIRLAKDSQGQYYAGGPFTGAYGTSQPSNVDMLWGLKVVQSPRIASGTVLVGGFQEGGQLFRRQGVTVEMANQNEDDFTHNLITVRAESRSALAVYRPGAFGTVTVTWA